MIFSQLFSPNYKSSDPEKRIASVEKLDKDKEKDKRILHELAFNDANETVSLAALNKLNSFVLWMKTAETSSSARIKKHAQHVCLTQLEDTAQVSDKLFLPFVKENKNKPFLEQMLFTSKRLNQHETVSVEILLTLNNTAHTRRFFQEIASITQQESIVKSIDDTKTLNRLAKYAKVESVRLCINEKLALLADLAEKPSKVKQEMTMINSRLLALKEVQDYEYLSQQLEQLSGEFEHLKSEFRCLDELTRATITEKYLGLKVLVQQKLSKLEEAYKSQLQLKRTTNDLSDIEERCTQVQTQIDLISGVSVNTETINSNIEAEVKILSSSLNYASEELAGVTQRAQTQTHSLKAAQLAALISGMQLKLSQVFEIIEYVHEGSKIELELASLINTIVTNDQAVQAISQRALTDIKSQINVHKDAFNTLKANAKGLLPAKTLSHFAKTLTNANKITKQIGQQFKDLESKCENKVKTVNRLIKDGKFKPAMSTFFHAKKLYEDISDYAPARLQKAFEQTEQEVTKLQDWQSYIAQPRKPAMLTKAQELADGQFEDPYERAEQVKQLRQEWNSLGLLHTPEDEAHNKAFDAHIEKAFLPCRVFFAALERQREENYQKALGLIEEAKTLNTEMPAAELASKMSSLKTQFNKLGEIDKAKVNKVRREFTKLFKPLGNVISSEQHLNAQQKQGLITQASKLKEDATDDDLLLEAIDKAKTLQQKWKQIGFAGKAIDNKLWNDFRQVNDALFERYHQSVNNKKSAQQQKLSDLDNEISSIVLKIKAAKAISDLQFYDQHYADVYAKVQDIDDDTKKRVQQKLRNIEDAYAACVKQLNKAKKDSALSNLFAFLHEYESEALPEQFEFLLSRYKSWIKGDVATIKLLDGLNRSALTQVAAILFDIAYNDVPVGDKSIRQELQLKMMAAKMQGEEVFGTEVVLAKWVSLGAVQKNEQESLQAMQKMYIG